MDYLIVSFPFAYGFVMNVSVFSSVPVLVASGPVLTLHALESVLSKEDPTSQHLMKNSIPSLETVAMS